MRIAELIMSLGFRTYIRFIIVFCGVLQLYPALALADRATGLLPEDPKAYSAMPQVEIYRDFIAPEADLSAYFPKPGNQGQQSSCTAWATAYAARTYHEAKQQNIPPKDSKQSFSPAYGKRLIFGVLALFGINYFLKFHGNKASIFSTVSA